MLDPKASDFRCKNELVTIEKCEFSEGKTNDSVVWASNQVWKYQMRPLTSYDGILSRYVPEILAPLESGAVSYTHLTLPTN